MKLIPLTQGKFAMVDDELFEELNKFKWCALKKGRNFYAVRNMPGARGTNIYMHRAITDALPGQEPDHVDGNGLNNLLTNLSLGDHLANTHSFLKRRVGVSSEYRGVYWDKRRQKWHASLQHAGQRHFIGYFSDEKDAAKAFDMKARELGWPEQGLNFPIR